jgi:hypothetical protein
MADRRNDPNEDLEVALGGADAVPGTPFVTGCGTEPEDHCSPGGLPLGLAGTMIFWIALAIAVFIALAAAGNLARL